MLHFYVQVLQQCLKFMRDNLCLVTKQVEFNVHSFSSYNKTNAFHLLHIINAVLEAHEQYCCISLLKKQTHWHSSLEIQTSALHGAYWWSLMHSNPSAQGMSVQLWHRVMSWKMHAVVCNVPCLARIGATIIFLFIFFTRLPDWLRMIYSSSP